MNSIKKIIKASVLLLIVFTVACKDKDIPTHDDKHHIECTKKGTRIPMGCVGDYLGIMDSDNKLILWMLALCLEITRSRTLSSKMNQV